MISTIGMIGTGNMGSAILRGIVDADYVKASQIIAYDTSSRRIRELEEDIPGVEFVPGGIVFEDEESDHIQERLIEDEEPAPV